MAYKALAEQRGEQLKESEQRLWEARQQIRELQNAAAESHVEEQTRSNSFGMRFDSVHEVADLRTDVEAKQKRISELQADLDAQHASMSEEHTRVAGLEIAKDNLKAYVAAQQKQILELGDKLQRQNAEHERIVSNMHDQIEGKADHIEDKANQIDGLETSRAGERHVNGLRVAQLEETTAKLNDSLEAQREANERLRANVVDKATKLSAQDNTLKAQCSENNHLGAELKQKIAKVSKLDRLLEFQHEEAQRLERELRANAASISELTTLLDAQRKEKEERVFSLEAELKTKTDHASDLTVLLAAERDTKETAHARISDLEDQLKESEEGLAVAGFRQSNRTGDPTAGSDVLLSEARSTISDLESINTGLNSTISSLNGTITGLRSLIDSQDNKIRDLRKKREAERYTSSAAINDKSAQLAEAQREIEKSTQDYLKSEENLRASEKELGYAKEETEQVIMAKEKGFDHLGDMIRRRAGENLVLLKRLEKSNGESGTGNIFVKLRNEIEKEGKKM